ncbi:MAG: hypothetical protein ACREDY_21525, partial [Bradyrhizobium sp.]
MALTALAFFASAAHAQDDSRTTPTRGPLAERLGRIRRSLNAEFAPDEPARHVHSTRPRTTEAAPPRMTNQSAVKASTANSRGESAADATEAGVKSSAGHSASSRRTTVRSHAAEGDQSEDVP